MDGLLHAAVEAEDILSKAKGFNSSYSHFGGGSSQEKMTWSNDKIHLSDPTDVCRTRYHRTALGSLPVKEAPSEKFDIIKKLHELYKELNNDDGEQHNYQGLKSTSYLLEKILARYNLNTLIFNLYPGNKGYSISLKVDGSLQYLHPPDGGTYTPEDTLLETPMWPYEEEDLLNYIDNEELPLILLDLLEGEHSNLFYSGCVIAQIRDYRQAYPNFMCDTHHVLLRPTTQSIITDASTISARAGHSTDQRLWLESKLTLATAPPLCLDPRPAVGLLSARMSASTKHLNTPQLRRQARRFSQVSVNRKRKLDQFTATHGLELLDQIHRQRAKQTRTAHPHPRLTSKYPKKPPETFRTIEAPQAVCGGRGALSMPADVGCAVRLARAYERPRPSHDYQPALVEEYILETDKNSQQGTGCFHIKLSILQRPSDQEFLGELYVDRDYVEGETNGASCRFALGTRLHANKYIQQFTEIFTEEGRKSVRIKHIMPGQPPRVSFTHGMRAEAAAAQQQRPQVSGVQAPAQSPASGAAAAPTPPSPALSTTPVSATVVVPHQTATPTVVTSATTSIPNIISTQRSLPILQAQLQSSSSPVYSDTSSVKQVVEVANAGTTLISRQPAIIHIQQQPTHKTLQQSSAVSGRTTTNPAISAIVTSLMNSAQQFQQRAASQNAAKDGNVIAVSSAPGQTSSNATILNLLNSAPAAMTHPTPTRIAPQTYTSQVITGFTSSVNVNTTNSNSCITSIANSVPTEANVLSLASLQGLQNVQVQIPGLSAPISLSLNVSGSGGGAGIVSNSVSNVGNSGGNNAPLIVSAPHAVVLSNAHNTLSIAQLMSSGVKGGNVQLVSRARRPQNAGTSQLVTQTMPASQVRRKSNQDGPP